MTSLCVEVVGLFIYQVLLSTHTVNDGNRDHWGCMNVHISSPIPTGPDQPGRLRQIFRNHTRAQVSHQRDKALNISYLKYLKCVNMSASHDVEVCLLTHILRTATAL